MNPEQWLSLKWNGGSTMSDRWLNQSKIIQLYLQELVKQENLQHSFSCFELQKEIDCALQIFLWMNGITSDSQEEIQRKINQNRSIGICKRII